MPVRIPLFHPDLGVTIERTPRQAEVLAESGWQRPGTTPEPSEPSEPPQPEHDESASGDADVIEETGDGEQEL